MGIHCYSKQLCSNLVSVSFISGENDITGETHRPDTDENGAHGGIHRPDPTSLTKPDYPEKSIDLF